MRPRSIPVPTSGNAPSIQISEETISELRELLVKLAHRAYFLGLVPAISGNLSMRIPGREQILIKATGLSLGDMTVADTLLIDFDGNVVQQSTRRPSKERYFHLAIYRERPDVGAVAHLHPPYALAFAATHQLPPMLTGASRAFLGGKVALVAPAPSGSKELADLVGEAFSDPKIMAAILSEHGTITVGRDLYEAFYLSQYLEDAARTAILVDRLRTSQT